MTNLTPVKLSPAFKDYLWGGERLKTEFNKHTDMTPLAESWELSAHKDGQWNCTVCLCQIPSKGEQVQMR